MRTTRYLDDPNAVCDLLVPATEELGLMAVAHLVPIMGVVGWRFPKGYKAILRAVADEFGGLSSTAVKELMLREAVPLLRVRMQELQTVRLGTKWICHENGRKRRLRPSRDLGFIRESIGSAYKLNVWPTRTKMNAFMRYVEKEWLRLAIRCLGTRADFLDGARLAYGVSDGDALGRIDRGGDVS